MFMLFIIYYLLPFPRIPQPRQKPSTETTCSEPVELLTFPHSGSLRADKMQNRVHRIGIKNSVSFSLWRNQTSPATTIQNKKRENSRQIKIECVVARRGRTAEAKEHAFLRVLERMLSRDGIRIGAYDYISHHHTLRVCELYGIWRCSETTARPKSHPQSPRGRIRSGGRSAAARRPGQS